MRLVVLPVVARGGRGMWASCGHPYPKRKLRRWPIGQLIAPGPATPSGTTWPGDSALFSARGVELTNDLGSLDIGQIPAHGPTSCSRASGIRPVALPPPSSNDLRDSAWARRRTAFRSLRRSGASPAERIPAPAVTCGAFFECGMHSHPGFDRSPPAPARLSVAPISVLDHPHRVIASASSDIVSTGNADHTLSCRKGTFTWYR